MDAQPTLPFFFGQRFVSMPFICYNGVNCKKERREEDVVFELWRGYFGRCCLLSSLRLSNLFSKELSYSCRGGTKRKKACFAKTCPTISAPESPTKPAAAPFIRTAFSCRPRPNLFGVQSLPFPKKRGIAALLCLFLGCLGIHRFYVGKIGTGILWMLTFGLYGIGALVDLLVILCGSFRDRDGRRLARW